MRLKIIFGGDGGQGVQLISNILCSAAIEAGFFASLIPNYGLEQRGGASLAFIQLSDKPLGYPKFSEADIAVILSAQARERSEQFIIPATKKIDIDEFKDQITKNNIHRQSLNMFFLGVCVKELENKGVNFFQSIENQLEKYCAHKTGFEENKKALKDGIYHF